MALATDPGRRRRRNTGQIDQNIGAITANLGAFDASGERAARTSLLDREAQAARERLARTFALDPAGIQQGRAIRAYSGLEGARLNALDQLESELSQRTGAENRANLSSLGTIQGQLFDQGFANRQLGEQQRQFDVSQLGTLNGQDTLARQGQMFGQDFSNRQLQQQGEQFGQSLAEQGRQFNAGQTGFIGGQATLARRAQDLSEIQFNQQLGEQARQFNVGQLGSINGQDTLAARTLAEQTAARVGSQGLQAQQLEQQGQQFQQTLQEQVAARMGAQSLQERGLDIQQSLNSGNLELAQAQLQENKRQFNTENERLVAQYAGNLGLSVQQFLADVDLRQQGIDLQNEQLNAAVDQFNRELGQRQTEFDTTFGETQRQFDDELSITRQNLAQQYGLQEAELFGGAPPLVTSGGVEGAQAQWQRVFNTRMGDANYNADFDLNRDGRINFDDFIEYYSNAVDLGNGIRQYVPPRGQATIAARRLGLETAQLQAAIQQNLEQNTELRRQYDSNFAGVLFDSQGNAISRNGQPITALERDQFQLTQREFNRRFNTSFADMAASLGIVPEAPGLINEAYTAKYNAERRRFLDNEFLSTVANDLRAEGLSPNDPAWTSRLNEGIQQQRTLAVIEATLTPEQKQALSDTVAQAIFGVTFQQPARQPNILAQAAGGFLGTLLGGA